MSRLMSILLQKSDPNYPWGFTLKGGRESGFPITIDKVTPGTLAAQYLAPGDRIIKIDNLDTSFLRQAEANMIIVRPTKCIDLLVLKCDDDDSERVLKSDSSASHKSRSSYNDSNRIRERFQNAKPSSSSESSNITSERESSSSRVKKQLFWEKCSRDNTDYNFGKGFTRMSEFVNGPTKERMSRRDEWKRCLSEEKSRYFSDDSQEYSSRPMHSVWSPSPTRKERLKNVKAESFSETSSMDRNTYSKSGTGSSGSFYKRRGSTSTYSDSEPSYQSYTVTDTTSEPFSPKSEPFSPKSEPFSPKSEPFSPKSEQFSPKTEPFSPKSDVFSKNESNFSFKSPLKKPSDFWNEHLKHEDGRSTEATIPRTSNCFWNNVNTFKQSSEFKRSISLCEKSYSSSNGPKAYEKIEKLNETKQVESSSINGKEERFEKSEKRKELVMSENDGDNESRKVVNDFKSVERKTGDTETCNKIKTHSEESSRTKTPPEFYDNTRSNIKSPNFTEPCSHKVEMNSQVLNVDEVRKVSVPVKVYDEEDVRSLVSISTINEHESEKEMKIGVNTKDIFSTTNEKWTSSTPVSENDVLITEVKKTNDAVTIEMKAEQRYTNEEKM